MFKIKIIKDGRCKRHFCQDRKYPSVYRVSEELLRQTSYVGPVLTDELVKKHKNHKWIDEV